MSNVTRILSQIEPGDPTPRLATSTANNVLPMINRKRQDYFVFIRGSFKNKGLEHCFSTLRPKFIPIQSARHRT